MRPDAATRLRPGDRRSIVQLVARDVKTAPQDISVSGAGSGASMWQGDVAHEFRTDTDISKGTRGAGRMLQRWDGGDSGMALGESAEGVSLVCCVSHDVADDPK